MLDDSFTKAPGHPAPELDLPIAVSRNQGPFLEIISSPETYLSCLCYRYVEKRVAPRLN
jgi:hypothetical protein